MNVLKGNFRLAQRTWILVAAVMLLPVLFVPVLPIWQMKLWAPQYREGLSLTIYTNNIRGNIESINTLNHYVGMKDISAADFKEFNYLPLALTLFGVMALMAAVANHRGAAAIGWLAFTVFSIYMFGDYARWLYDYGHHLDARAPIKLPLFTPPLIGLRRMANFRVLSLPGPGTLLLGVAWLVGPVILLLEWRAERRIARRAPAAVTAGA